MTIPFCEKYSLGRRTFGIEDHHDGKPGHFFPDSARKRFALWHGGCGMGQADTIEEARKLLHTYIINQLRAEQASAQRALDQATSDLAKLEGDVFFLGRIMT